MESSGSPFARALHYKKAMLRQELMPYLTLSEVRSMLLLNKVSYHLIREHFCDSVNSFDNMINLMAYKHWRIDKQDLVNYFEKRMQEEEKGLMQEEVKGPQRIKVEDLLNLDGKMLPCTEVPTLTFKRFDKKRQVFDTLAFANGGWTWMWDQRYWVMKDLKETTFGRQIYHLKAVCFFDPFVEAYRVVPEGKYKVFLLHGIAAGPQMVNQCDIHVEVIVPGEQACRELYKKRFMTSEMLQSLSPERIEKTYITTIDLSEIGKLTQELVTVKVRFWGDSTWKNGWYFEGMILEPEREV